MSSWLKLKFRQYLAKHTNCTAPLYNIFDTVVTQKQIFKRQHHQVLCADRLTCPAYVDGWKRENSSFLKDLIIVTSTCRRFVQFAGVDTNFEKLETVGLPTPNFQEPQVKFWSPNLTCTTRKKQLACYRGVWT